MFDYNNPPSLAKQKAVQKCTAFCFTTLLISWRSASAYQADQEEQDNRAKDGNDQTGKVKASHSLCAKDIIHQEAADQGAHNTNDDIGESSHLSISSHDDTSNPSSDGTEDDP